MKQRVLTGAALTAFMILLFFTKSITPYVFDAFIIYVAVAGGIEMSNLLAKFNFYNNKLAIIIYPFLSYGLFKFCSSQELSLYLLIVLQIALLILVTGIIMLFGLLCKKRSENEIKTRKLNCSVEQFSVFKSVQTLFAMIYPAFIMVLLLFINNIQNLTYIFTSVANYGGAISLFLLIYVFVIPIFVDTFAMLTGMIFKGKKLCEKISPNKTISGAIGGLFWGVLAAVAMFYIFNSIDSYRLLFIMLNLSWWKMLIVGLVSAILCQLGDIFESFIKRKANVKDSGDLLPGHGGILDRIDSHIANVIVTFVFMLLLL